MQKDTGPSTRIYYLAKSLANLGNDVHIVVPGQKGLFRWSNNLYVRRFDGFFPTRILKRLSTFIGVMRPTSLYFYDLLFVLRTLRIVFRCHLVQIEQPWASGLLVPLIVKAAGKPLVVDSHDAFQSLRTKRTSLRRLLEVFLEKMIYRHADAVLTVSEEEKRILVNYGVPEQKIVVIPNGVDTQAFDPSKREGRFLKNFSDSYKVIFVGNMEYWPNHEASRLIESRIAPRIWTRINKVVFFMVGRIGADDRFSSPSGMVFTGSVDDVRSYLNSSDVAIAPLFHGSGTRLKILEYFSCALPVVSTTVGVEGLDVENGVNVLIADDVDEFAQKVIDLLSDSVLRQKLGKAARALVVSKYDWGEIGKRLNDTYHVFVN